MAYRVKIYQKLLPNIVNIVKLNQQNYNQHFKTQANMKIYLLKSFTIIMMVIGLSQSLYCSSSCIDYVGACFDDTPQGCWVCANKIYNLVSNIGSATPCSLLNQRAIIANQLSNTGMSLAGYTSTKPSTITFTNYTLSGQYTNADSLYKNFTNIPLNHYALVIRYSVGYIGNWSQTDYLRLNMKDSSININYDVEYRCQNPESIFDPTNINATDCIRHRQQIITHNSSFVQLTFSALTTQSDPNVQFWGIKQLIIAAKLCHDYCLTCFGQKNSECLSCKSGYYLQGNVCLPTCENMHKIHDSNICVSKCPSRYYANINLNGQKQCLNCGYGCEICSSSTSCQTYIDGQPYVPNAWKDKIEFWILLIILACSAIFIIIYKCIKNKKQQSQIEKKMIQKSDEGTPPQKHDELKHDKDLNKNGPSQPIKLQQSNESIIGPTIVLKEADQLWFNQLEQVQTKKMKIRKRIKKLKDPTYLISQQNIQIDEVIIQDTL